MEPAIRHVRFFNGQFLKEDEFREEQAYSLHMRRRVNYAMLEDGVCEVVGDELSIVPVTPGTPADKRIRVTRGMAVGTNREVLESREIIQRVDSNILDLTSFGGGTVWVTANYRREENTPVSVGTSTQNSRVDETAELQLHASRPSGVTTAGDPLIVLGSVNVATMIVSLVDRRIARLRPYLFTPTPTISLSPSTFAADGVVHDITITSGGGFNLSALTPADVTFDDDAGVSTPVTIVGTPTASSATIRFSIATTQPTGTRRIMVSLGGASPSAAFAVTAFVPAPTITTTPPGTFPGSTSPDELLAINGTNFVGSVSVRFNNGGAAKNTFTGSGESLSSTRIVLRVPTTGAASGTLTITAAGGSVTSPFINIA